LTVLKLEHYQKLELFLGFAEKRKVAIEIAQTAVSYGPNIPAEASVNRLLEFIEPLIKDSEQKDQKTDEEDFEEEQNLVASLVNLFKKMTLMMNKCLQSI